ncbi:hypothetical protein [Metapseudomonas otitidis]|uniref:hypothetical protein n=1 Tax=Metapseudomonas otitidis TaxID=319939 RepID=UPI0008EA5A08|nr:hypothetical protein [Pseudomonas otitidis]SFA65594.1 hypothetical protein SAMN05216263_11886 [Pseudomonas otitidis]
MSRLLSMIGIVISLLYLGFAYWLIGDRLPQLQTMELNALGDFFAGIFGPLAILWLILGFFQQGVELKQGTKALLLQAEELRNSVEQQAIMASAATQQIQAQMRAVEIQEEARKKAISPSFSFETGNRWQSTEGIINTQTVLANRGHVVWDVRLKLSPSIGGVSEISRPKLDKDEGIVMDFVYQRPDVDIFGECEVSYVRRDSEACNERFIFVIQATNQSVFFERPAPTANI